MGGWVKLHRQIQDNPLYFSEPFNRALAWIDLLLLANHKDAYFFKRGVKVDVKIGQIGYDIESLSKRWKWSRGKVERFLKTLENENQIVRQKNNVTTLISIVNYIEYQVDDKANGKTNSKANGHQIVNQTVNQTDTNKNVNNDNNDNNEKNVNKPISNIVDRKLKFASTLKPFVDIYGKQMLNEFYAYWTEPNKSNTKFKQELEKTWSLERRLERWASNDKNFKKSGNGTTKQNADEAMEATKRRILGEDYDDGKPKSSNQDFEFTSYEDVGSI